MNGDRKRKLKESVDETSQRLDDFMIKLAKNSIAYINRIKLL